MRDMIYYPGFEVRDKVWLKFALLYFDNLRPIIPYTIVPETEYLSDGFRYIMNETDLVRPYRPQYEEGICASTLACDELEGYLRNPERYKGYFGRPDAIHLPKKWRSREHQNCTLFEGKYSDVFFNFCIENSIASPCEEGIHISEDLAFVYMSLLADVISRNNEFEMITDIKRYSALLLKNEMIMAKSTQNILRIAQNNIDFYIPNHLRNIPIEQIVHLRNQRNFEDTRKAYIKEIERLIENKENIRPDYSLEELLSYKKDFIRICEQSFEMIAAATVTVYSFAALGDGIQGTEIISAMASAFMDYKAAKDAIFEIPQFIEQLKTKRLARKYVAKVSRLNATYHHRGW